MYIVFDDYQGYHEYVIGVYSDVNEAIKIADENNGYCNSCGVEKIKEGARYNEMNNLRWGKIYETIPAMDLE